jgi:hypothetical protein
MLTRTTLRRRLLVGTAATAVVVLGAAPAMAHNCYVPMYGLNGPRSANWLVFSAEDGAAIIAQYEAECPGAERTRATTPSRQPDCPWASRSSTG